jgi:hypothetical protein
MIAFARSMISCFAPVLEFDYHTTRTSDDRQARQAGRLRGRERDDGGKSSILAAQQRLAPKSSATPTATLARDYAVGGSSGLNCMGVGAGVRRSVGINGMRELYRPEWQALNGPKAWLRIETGARPTNSRQTFAPARAQWQACKFDRCALSFPGLWR